MHDKYRTRRPYRRRPRARNPPAARLGGHHRADRAINNAEDKKRLQQNAADLQEMFFLVVVVGEFNAGKSTFVNALIGDELLPMGITPTTDAIELIRWSSKRRNDYAWREKDVIREWLHPNTGGPGVVIVDTPGTGSVFRKHETIAKNFLSRSDLVIFLLSAKRALAETERLYLELARDYGKKIVVVINQADLLQKREQKEVQTFVQQQLQELLGLRPEIFMVSAKEALTETRQCEQPVLRRTRRSRRDERRPRASARDLPARAARQTETLHPA